MSKNPSTSMTNITLKLELCSILRSSMHTWPGTWVAIGRAVVYSARAVHTFSAGITRQHCSLTSMDSRLTV